MKIRHEICIDNKGDTDKCCNEILVALGHGPGFKLKADTPDDTVHGALTIAHCDPRTLATPGVDSGDVILFADGSIDVATPENIGKWFEEQGHKLLKIVGDKAYGNTIIDIKITDTDEAPNKFHKTTYKRAAVLPTAKDCCDKINAHLTLKGMAV